MEFLKSFIGPLETRNQELKDKIFIDKLPTNFAGVGVVVSEKVSISQTPTFNNTYTSYQKRHASVYVYSKTNNIQEARKHIFGVYKSIRENPFWSDNIDGAVPEQPIYVGEIENQIQVYVMQVACYYHNN